MAVHITGLADGHVGNRYGPRGLPPFVHNQELVVTEASAYLYVCHVLQHGLC